MRARVQGVVAVLRRAHKDHAGHAHLNVLYVLKVAVIHVGAFAVRAVEIGHLPADGHRHRNFGHAVIERGGQVETMPVDGVRVDQVWPLDQAQVGQGDLDVIVLFEVQDGARCAETCPCKS